MTNCHGPLTRATGAPDTGVTPRTTNRTIIESPPLQRDDSAPLDSQTDGTTGSGGGYGDQLVYPKGLSETERAAVEMQLEPLPVELAQQLLDELAGRMAANAIHLTPLAYLRGLVRRAQTGEFTPEVALRVSAERKRQRQTEAILRQAEAAHRKALQTETNAEDNPLVRRLVAIRDKAQHRNGNNG